MTVENAAWALLKLLQAALIFRLAQSRLAGRYPAFTIYLVLSLFSTAVLLIVAQAAYTTWWIYSAHVLLLALAASVVEVHVAILRHIEPIRNPRFHSALLVLISAAICAVTLEAHQWTSRVKTAYLNTRFVTGTLAAWMILQAAAFPKIHPPLPDVLVSHGRILAIYVAIQAATFAAVNLLAPYAPRALLSTILMLAQCACLIAWLFSFRREHELPQPPPQVDGGGR